MLSPVPFPLSAIMRAAHAEVRAIRDGLRRGAAAGYSLSKADLARFDYRAYLGRALKNAWAAVKAERLPPVLAIDPAEYASTFEAWAAERRPPSFRIAA